MIASNASLVGVAIMTNADGHHDLFKGSVAGAFADAVDGALDLAGSSGDGCHGVGHGHAEIVVAMGGDSDVFDSLNALANGCDELAEFRGDGVADRVGDVECGGTGFYDSIEHLAEKFRVGASSVFGGKFDIIAERLGEGNRLAGLDEALFTGDAQFGFQVNVGSG